MEFKKLTDFHDFGPKQCQTLITLQRLGIYKKYPANGSLWKAPWSALPEYSKTLENCVKSNRLPRRPTRKRPVAGNGFPKNLQNIGKHAFLTKTATQQIQWGRAGPRVHYADPSSLRRRMSKILGETKGNGETGESREGVKRNTAE